MTPQPAIRNPQSAIGHPQSVIGNPQWITFAVFAGLAVLAAVIASRDLNVGGFSWSDAPLHAMDGVLLHDLIVERPQGSLRDWAQQYYLRHQCLGLIVYYPPLFAAVEAVVFFLLGVSVAAARLTVLIFVIPAVWLVYLLARDMFGKPAGIAAAILSIAAPAGVTWSRQVLLEWPAMLFIMLTLLTYRRYLRQPRWSAGVLAAVGCLFAYLTKQTAVFVLIVILVHAWWDLRWRTLLRRSFLVPMAMAILVIVGYGIATAGYNRLTPQLILGSPPLQHLLHTRTWTWYLYRLPVIIGWPMLIVVAVAVTALAVTCMVERFGQLASALRAPEPQPAAPADTPACDRDARTDHQGTFALPAIWLFLWWLICSAFSAKEERYFFYAVPALAILTAAWLGRFNGPRRVGIGTAALVVLCGIQVFLAVRTPAYRLPTMRETIDFLFAQGDADLVLLDAVRDGQFIFDVRTSGRAHHCIIPMRASKFLYSRSARTRYDYQAHIATADQLYDWLDRYGIRYVVIESGLPDTLDRSWEVPPRTMLRETVNNRRHFQRLFTQPLAGDDPVWQNVNLVTYRYRDAKPRQADAITVRIPAMGREITLTLPPAASRPAPP